MKICLVHDEHYPHHGADTIVVINTAAALGAAGAEVDLVTPRLWGHQLDVADLCKHYGVRQTFRHVRLPSFPPPNRRLRLEKGLHGVAGPLYAALRGADLVHSRELLPLLVTRLLGRPWSFETYRRHGKEKCWLPPLTRRLRLDRAVGAVAHSQAAAADLAALGFGDDAVLVARPGYDPDLFTPPLDTATARHRCGLALDGPVVGYAGNLDRSKGVGDIVELAGRVPEAHYLLVGGTPEEVAAVRADVAARGLANVTLVGHQPPARVAQYLYAADALFVTAIFKNTFAGSLFSWLPLNVLPGTPLKIYGYLAAGRPIISAKQLHTQDLLRHEENALLVPVRDDHADVDPDAAAAALRRLLADPALAARLAATAQAEAQEYTWTRRGQQMLEFFARRLAATGWRA